MKPQACINAVLIERMRDFPKRVDILQILEDTPRER